MQYRAIHISYPDWEDASPLFYTEEAAQKWLAGRIDASKRDWGYLCYFDDEGNQITKEAHDALIRRAA